MDPFTLTRSQVREVDRRAIEEIGMSGLVLMENAGRGCVDVLRALHAEGPVAIVCGKGNNAGDGFVIARHLDNFGIESRVLLVGDASELSGDAEANFKILSACSVTVVERFGDLGKDEREQRLEGAKWIVDALLGTGATGSPRAPYDQLIRQLNGHPATRLAVDLPSGLDCDSGEAFDPTFRADHTCTFVAPKPGLLGDAAQKFVGTMHLIDIGVPCSIVDDVRNTPLTNGHSPDNL